MLRYVIHPTLIRRLFNLRAGFIETVETVVLGKLLVPLVGQMCVKPGGQPLPLRC